MGDNNDEFCDRCYKLIPQIVEGNFIVRRAVGATPAILGMMLGQKLRARLPEQQFRRVFFAALLLLGVYIITNAL